MAPGTLHPNLRSAAGAPGCWQLSSPPGKCSDPHRTGPRTPLPPGTSPAGYWHRLQTLNACFLFRGWTDSSRLDPAVPFPFFHGLCILVKRLKKHLCNHAFLLTHILSAGSNPAHSCSRFSLLNPPWVAGEAELVTREENQALGGGKGNVRDSADPGGAGAEPHVRFLFCRDSCKPEPLAGMILGADFKGCVLC